MKLFHLLTLASTVAAAAIDPRHLAGRKAVRAATTTTSAAAAASSSATAATSNNDVVAGQTLVLKETGGVPGNECLTFRNNGEIVDADCVNTAADRQITPAEINGKSVLRVQRSFAADFRPDLVGVDVCVGFNGTVFKATACSETKASTASRVVFTGGQLKTADGNACASGHDSAAQLTVDTTGKTCASYTTTDVQPAATR